MDSQLEGECTTGFDKNERGTADSCLPLQQPTASLPTTTPEPVIAGVFVSFLVLLVVAVAICLVYLRWKNAKAKRKCIHGIVEHGCDNVDIDPELNQFELNPAAGLVACDNGLRDSAMLNPYYINPLSSGETARPLATGSQAAAAEPVQESKVHAEEASLELTAAAVFDAVDADDNGTISLVEFQQWWNARQEEAGTSGDEVTSQAAVLFAELDTDGSQTLDTEEFALFIEEMAIGGCSSWKEHKDSASGRMYYVNQEAGKTQWVKPGKAEVKTWLAARLGSSNLLGARQKGTRKIIMEMNEEMAAEACNDLDLTPEDISLAGMQAILVEYHCTARPVPPTLPGPPPMLAGPPMQLKPPALLHSDGTPHVRGDAHADHSLALPPRQAPRQRTPLNGPPPTLRGPAPTLTGSPMRSAPPALAEAAEMRELIMMMDEEMAAETCNDDDLTPDDISLAGMQAALLLHHCGPAGATKDSSGLPPDVRRRVPPTLTGPTRSAPGGMPEHPGDMPGGHTYTGMLPPPPTLTGPPSAHPAPPALLHSDGTRDEDRDREARRHTSVQDLVPMTAVAQSGPPAHEDARSLLGPDYAEVRDTSRTNDAEAAETRELIMMMDEEMAAEACVDSDLTPEDISLAGMQTALILHHCGPSGSANETVASTVEYRTFEIKASMEI
jgi:hypothetical protein